MKLIPISSTNFDVTAFIKILCEGTGGNPLRGADAAARPLTDTARLLAGLAAFRDRDDLVNPLAAIRESRSVQRHLHYSFLVIGYPELVQGIRDRTDLVITNTPAKNGLEIALVSGLLSQWRDATLECCDPTAPTDLRAIFDEVFTYFDRLGLGDLWHDCRRRGLPDQTFLIEYK